MHDPTLLSALAVTEGPGLGALNGGTGAELFLPESCAAGFTLGVVFSTTDPLGQVLTASAAVEFAVVSYSTVRSGLQGDPDGSTTQIIFLDGSCTSSPIDPIVTNVVSVGGQTAAASKVFGVITFVPLPGFVRAECNLDGLYDISDGVFLLIYLFLMGGPLGCDDACDGNDDGLLDIADPLFIFTNLFVSGPNPAAPFPACGTDPTADALDCDGSLCP